MKKIVLAGALLATMGIGAFSVYADSGSAVEFSQEYGHMRNNNGAINKSHSDREILTEEERDERYSERQADRTEYREERIKLALAEGWITEEEATERRAEVAERDQVYEVNGFNDRGYHHGGMRKAYRQGRSYRCH